jgi:hypothetical protein
MIFSSNSFGRGFSPLSNLNIKLSSFTVLERKERRRYTMCTRVNRDLLTSVVTSTAILHRVHPVVDMNYDPFLDLLGTSTIVD